MSSLCRTMVTGLSIAGLTAGAAHAADLPDFARRIHAGTVAAISDGDFVAQSYVDGRLAPRVGGTADTLTVHFLGEGGSRSASLPVSNSVTAPPEVLELSPNGATAFVVERLGERSASAEKVADLPPGNRLFAVDLRNPAGLELIDTATVAASPEALAIHPAGSRIAVVSNTAEASILTVIDLDEGGFGTPAAFDLKAYGVSGTAQAPRGGVTITNVQWHPSGRFVAINIDSQDRVAFFEVSETPEGFALRPWGDPVGVGKDPFVGRFTPDGGHYLTADWGRDFKATSVEGRLPAKPSSISVVRLGDPQSVSARHEKVGATETDQSSEGLAVSPDGSLVATVNMRGTVFGPSSDRFTREASVTLLSFDAATGALEKLGDYPFEGVLPEGGTFDLSGAHFLATVFEGHAGSEAEHGSGVEVFRVVRGPKPSLERLGRIAMPHGVHHVDLAR